MSQGDDQKVSTGLQNQQLKERLTAQRQEREIHPVRCSAYKDLVAGTLECFFCRALLTYAAC